MKGVEASVWCYPLPKRRQTLGRSRSCDIRIDHPSVSRVHAEIRWQNGSYFLCDLDSKNGSFFNGKRIKEVPFDVGDTLRLARVTLEVVARRIKEKTAKSLESSTHSFELSPDATGELITLLDVSSKFGLSRAQCRVLRLLLQGLSEKQVATQLKLSQHTIHTHTKNIYRALGVHTRAELLARYWAGPLAKPKNV
jgi:pSer/pThr/pTyr-binding forkhead associated (FHA) protein